MPSVTEIPRGTNDLVRSLPKTSAPGGRLSVLTVFVTLRGGVLALSSSSSHCELPEAEREATPMAGCGQLVSLSGLRRNEEPRG